MRAEKTDFTGFSSPQDPSRGQASDPAAPAGALWLGPGTLFRDLGPVLEVLAAGAARDAGSSAAPPAIESLSDLDRLLDPPPPSGRLLLEVDGLPTEDIGLVRRFLRRYGGWSLILCGGDPRDSTVRALAGDRRSRWLAWPPDLDQMRALVGGDVSNGQVPPRASSAASAPTGLEPEGGELAAQAVPPLTDGGGDGFDLGELVEEVLASAALDEAPPHYVYRTDGDLGLALPPEDVAAVVDAVLGLARVCGGEGAEISVEARPGAGDAVELEVGFPEGPLAGLGARRLLEPAALDDRIGDADLDAFARAAATLDTLGGAARAARPADGRVELTVTLPRAG